MIIAIPSTFTSNTYNRFVRAYVIGEVARFCSMFGVTAIWVYYDPDPKFESHGLGKYVVKLLKYAITPPWLKKKVFPLKETDRYMGVMPPLNIRAHEKTKIGDYWFGYVKRLGEKVLVIGPGIKGRVEKRALVRGGYRGKDRELVLMKGEAPVDVWNFPREPYMGFYPIYFAKGIKEVVAKARDMGLKLIGTSKKGKGEVKLKDEDIVLVFGGPNRGLYEIEGFDERDFDLIFNALPGQKTKTIRTEEAIPLVLEAVKLISSQFSH